MHMTLPLLKNNLVNKWTWPCQYSEDHIQCPIMAYCVHKDITRDSSWGKSNTLEILVSIAMPFSVNGTWGPIINNISQVLSPSYYWCSMSPTLPVLQKYVQYKILKYEKIPSMSKVWILAPFFMEV